MIAGEDDRPGAAEQTGEPKNGAPDRSTAQASIVAIEALLERPEEAMARRAGRVAIWSGELDGRRVTCKYTRPDGPGRVLADLFRGSEARRAFRRGRADALISDRAARPLACVERRLLGLPLESWLIMETVGEADLDTFVPRSSAEAERLWLGLADWLAELHARGLGHRDLKGGNVRVGFEADRPIFRLVDLTDLQGPAPIDEPGRVHALAQLNASIADELAEAPLRMKALERSANRLAFSDPLSRVAADIARQSVARAHRWQGTDCVSASHLDV